LNNTTIIGSVANIMMKGSLSNVYYRIYFVTWINCIRRLYFYSYKLILSDKSFQSCCRHSKSKKSKHLHIWIGKTVLRDSATCHFGLGGDIIIFGNCNACINTVDSLYRHRKKNSYCKNCEYYYSIWTNELASQLEKIFFENQTNQSTHEKSDWQCVVLTALFTKL